MKVIRAITIFLLGLLVIILVGAVGLFGGYQYGLLLPSADADPWVAVVVALYGLPVGVIVGIFLSLRFTKYFGEKIWPSETKAAP